MNDDTQSTRYWCHQCMLEVDPILEIESVKCSLCHDGFVEEMNGITSDHHNHGGPDPELDPDRSVSLLAPILLGLNNSHRRRRRFQQLEFDSDDIEHSLELHHRTRRSSATILQLLQGVHPRIASESENNTDTENQREHFVLINPFNQTIIVQEGSSGGNPLETRPVGLLGDYFSGPGLELLLQHLAENDPARHGTPPAKKEAVEAMPNVTVEEHSVQCSVCLDDFEVGTEAKQMPCKHRFHSECILPWLELHSSCPVCRFELPFDETKVDQERPEQVRAFSVGDGERNGRRFSVSIPWPFNGLFSSSGSGPGSGSGPESSPQAHRLGDREDNS